MKKTLPTWSKTWPFNIDLVRKTVRESAELRKLGETFGAVRVFSEAEAEQIRQALEARASANRPAVVAS